MLVYTLNIFDENIAMSETSIFEIILKFFQTFYNILSNFLKKKKIVWSCYTCQDWWLIQNIGIFVFLWFYLPLSFSISSYRALVGCWHQNSGTHGVKDVQGSLTQAISDTDRNLGIKLTVCLHFALAIKHIKRFFCPFLPHFNPIAREF